MLVASGGVVRGEVLHPRIRERKPIPSADFKAQVVEFRHRGRDWFIISNYSSKPEPGACVKNIVHHLNGDEVY